ncbi:MAG: FMN-binding negative transcriptional regulator [Actinomycetota bacterium]
MHRPSHFALDDRDALTVVAETGFVQLVSSGPDGFAVTPLPVLVDRGRAVLRGHVARANPHWRSLADAPVAVAVCSPTDGYVSPTWYPSKVEHGRVVPTWNHVTVAVHGTVEVHDDPEWVLALVRELSDAHEADRERPWSIDDAPAEFIAKQAKAIVGVELRIERVEGAAKLSQNRPVADREGVLDGLDDEPLLTAMRRWV